LKIFLKNHMQEIKIDQNNFHCIKINELFLTSQNSSIIFLIEQNEFFIQ